MNNSTEPRKQYGIKEIARKAKVSIATVDRVIHKRGGVARKTKERILNIIDEFDYQPNILASRLRSNKTFSLAILIPQVSENTDFWAAPYQGICKAQEEIGPFGINVKTYFYKLNQKSSFSEQAKLLLAEEPDGVVVAPMFIPEATALSTELTEAHIPFVYIDTYIPNQKNMTYIGPHIYHSGIVAGKLMLYGMREKEGEILVINHTNVNNDDHHIKEIERGFRDYVHQANDKIYIHILDYTGIDSLTMENKLIDYLKNNGRIEAVFVTNSRAFMVAAVLKKLSMEHKILIGFDNIDENVKLLKENVIDFLICHKPEEQGYRSVMNLYQNILLSHQIDKVQYMPIDIITKENCDFYS